MIRYGGPAPGVPGCIALDLHRMNKILEVNDKFSYAVVEPGVTFGDLYEYCAKNKLKVWPSTASLGWGSVIGNVGSSPRQRKRRLYSQAVDSRPGFRIHPNRCAL